MPVFEGAKDFNITNCTFIDGDSNNVDPMRLLTEHACLGAIHDSAERYDAPRCYPNTRTSILETIQEWAEGSGQSILWLHGAAGAGKSAIVQTAAERFKERTMPCATFNFSRTARGQSNIRHLVPTISYQLSMACPIFRAYIGRAISRDQLLFEKSLADQFRYLLMTPLEATIAQARSFPGYLLICIDGLDECFTVYKTQTHEEQQRQLLEIAMLATQQDLPVRFLIASRPEHQIRKCFDNNPSVQTLRLPEARLDIELYLETSFQAIREEHPTLGQAWPPPETIRRLVETSSGHFLYASTVIRHLLSPRVNPEIALEEILGARELVSDSRPFAQLDALYTHVLNSVEKQSRENVSNILRHLLLEDWVPEEPLESPQFRSPEYFALTFGTTRTQIYTDLVDLHSILDIPPHGSASTHPIRFIHASLGDFLLDPTRAGSHLVNEFPNLRRQIEGLSFILNSLFSSNQLVAIHLVYIFVGRECYSRRAGLYQRWSGLLAPNKLFSNRSAFLRLLLICGTTDITRSPLRFFPMFFWRNMQILIVALCMAGRMCIFGVRSPEYQVFDKRGIFPPIFLLARAIGQLQLMLYTAEHLASSFAGQSSQRLQFLVFGLRSGLLFLPDILFYAHFLPFMAILRVAVDTYSYKRRN